MEFILPVGAVCCHVEASHALHAEHSPMPPNPMLLLCPQGTPPEWNKFCQFQHCLGGAGGRSTSAHGGHGRVAQRGASWQNKFHQPTGHRCRMVSCTSSQWVTRGGDGDSDDGDDDRGGDDGNEGEVGYA